MPQCHGGPGGCQGEGSWRVSRGGEPESVLGKGAGEKGVGECTGKRLAGAQERGLEGVQGMVQESCLGKGAGECTGKRLEGVRKGSRGCPG